MLAVGAVFQGVGLLKSIIESFISLAVSPFPSPALPWDISQSIAHDFLARGGFGGRLHGIGLFDIFNRDRRGGRCLGCGGGLLGQDWTRKEKDCQKYKCQAVHGAPASQRSGLLQMVALGRAVIRITCACVL